jgi:tripartite-type tricarboxylate transporter receptor subunit TctC
MGRRLHCLLRWLCLLGACAVVATTPTHAQSPSAFPQRQVKIIVAYAAGNVTDVLARLLAEKLTERWGQQVIVENRPGQGGSLGTQALAKSAPDGYTLGFIAMAAIAINPHVYVSVGYDARKDLAPITAVATPQGMIVAHPGVGARSLKELVEVSRTRASGLNFGSSGTGTIPHLNFELLKQATGLKAEHVPYKGATQVTTDVIGGRLDMMQEALVLLLPHVRAGKLVPLAVMGAKRMAPMPELPTIGELVPGFEPVVPWLSLQAPAGTPAEVISRVHADVQTIVQSPDVRTRLESMGLDAIASAPADFSRQVQADYARLGQLVKRINLKVE